MYYTVRCTVYDDAFLLTSTGDWVTGVGSIRGAVNEAERRRIKLSLP
jgi:hypothetical protein